MIIRGCGAVLLLVLLEDDTRVVPTEAEGVRQGGTDGTALSLVEGEVQLVVDLGIFVVGSMVDRGGDNVLLYGLEREDSLDSTSAPRR